MHLVAIGGSDAGISAALRARELDPTTEVTVVVADAYPNFSICGIPYYVSGEVTHWRNLAHRTLDDLEATGMQVRLDTRATAIDVAGRTAHRRRRVRGRVKTPRLRPAGRRDRGGLGPSADRGAGRADALGPADGVHLLHSMGDTFALMRHPGRTDPRARSSSGRATSASRWPRGSGPGDSRSPSSSSSPRCSRRSTRASAPWSTPS